MHRLITCHCGIELFMPDMTLHRKAECPKRLIICRYCHVLVESGPLSNLAQDLLQQGPPITQHESECGSRTIQCINCSKSVQLKDVAIHMKMHEVEKANKQLPFQRCTNQQCCRSIDHGNGMRLCRICFGPLYVSQYDPDGKKRAQRLVHRYFQQLSNGCGRSTCQNQVWYLKNH